MPPCEFVKCFRRNTRLGAEQGPLRVASRRTGNKALTAVHPLEPTDSLLNTP